MDASKRLSPGCVRTGVASNVYIIYNHAFGFHCKECPDFDLCHKCYGKNGHHHPMEKFSTSENAPGQRAKGSSIKKELEVASVISPVGDEKGKQNSQHEMMTVPQQNGEMRKQEIQVKIDKENRMSVYGLLPGQRLYR